MLEALLTLLIRLYGGDSLRLTSLVIRTPSALKPSFAGTPGGGWRLKNLSFSCVPRSPTVSWIFPTWVPVGQAVPRFRPGRMKTSIEQRGTGIGEPTKPGGRVTVRAFS